MYRHVLDERLPQLVAVARALLEPAGMPAVIGCAAGKDRTGVTIALLLDLAGVPRDVIVEDYAMSADYFAGPNAHDPARGLAPPPSSTCDSPPEFMASTLRHLDERHGGARELLRAGGLHDAEMDALVDRLTEPAA